MASFDIKDIKCPVCGTLVHVTISYGIWPNRSEETADCPVCGKELLRKNITGDIETKVKSLDDTLEPYKTRYSLKSII